MSEIVERACEGERYEAEVPDTVDLAERAALAINGIGGTIDPELRTMYFNVQYPYKPSYMTHHAADTTCDPKYAESLPMLRLMSGNRKYADLEAAFADELVSRMDSGLYWNRVDPRKPWARTYNPQFDGDTHEEDVANPGGNGRMLRALVTWREVTGSDRWDETIRDLCRGLAEIAVSHGDYSYYPDGGFGEPFNHPRSGWVRTDEPMGETEGGEGSVLGYQGHEIDGLMRWWSMSGDATALDLSARLTRFCMLPKFWGGVPNPEGERGKTVGHVAPSAPDPAGIAGSEQGHWHSHFHARAIGLRGMLEFARRTGDEHVLEFLRQSYEYTWEFGIRRLGWVNCWPAAMDAVEACALGDLVAMGVRLSEIGVGDYWDDVDAVTRNMLAEQQLIDEPMLRRISEAGAERGPDKWDATAGREVREGVIERSLGNFAGAAKPDCAPNAWVMQCCTGNATQGLYYAWEAAVREEGDAAQVNLLLNRAGQSVNVESWLPYEGKVVVRSKSARRVSVRMPWWVGRDEVACKVGGRQVAKAWVGRYLVFEGLAPGDVVEIGFPVSETTASYTIASRTPAEKTYSITFRGSTAVDISPRDEAPTAYQMYLRKGMRTETAPMKRMQRFVAARRIVEW